MSLNKLMNTSIGHDLNLQIGCDTLLSDNVICDNLSCGALVFPNQLPDGKSIITCNNSTLKWGVSPYSMCNITNSYVIPPNTVTQIAGGNCTGALNSSSVVNAGDSVQYDFKIIGELFNSQPIVTFLLKWGNIVLNNIKLTKSITPGPIGEYIEISGNILIMAGYPVSTNITTNMKVQISPFYDNITSPLVTATPAPAVCVTNIQQTGGANILPYSQLAVCLLTPSGTATFVDYISTIGCVYSPELVV